MAKTTIETYAPNVTAGMTGILCDPCWEVFRAEFSACGLAGLAQTPKQLLDPRADDMAAQTPFTWTPMATALTRIANNVVMVAGRGVSVREVRTALRETQCFLHTATRFHKAVCRDSSCDLDNFDWMIVRSLMDEIDKGLTIGALALEHAVGFDGRCTRCARNMVPWLPGQAVLEHGRVMEAADDERIWTGRVVPCGYGRCCHPGAGTEEGGRRVN